MVVIDFRMLFKVIVGLVGGKLGKEEMEYLVSFFIFDDYFICDGGGWLMMVDGIVWNFFVWCWEWVLIWGMNRGSDYDLYVSREGM